MLLQGDEDSHDENDNDDDAAADITTAIKIADKHAS